MITSVFIDHCVWDFLFQRNMDLAVELPSSEYGIGITREAEFEIQHTPDVSKEGKDLKPLKAFIKETISKCNIRTDRIFSFFDPSNTMDEQRGGGFDNGRFYTYAEHEFTLKLQEKPSSSTKRSTRLFDNEADIANASRSLHSVVLTLNSKRKGRQPFQIARSNGGKVVFLNDFDQSGLSLKDFIQKELEIINAEKHKTNDAA